MNPSLRKYAPAGLYLALVAALAAGGLYIVEQAFNLPVQIALGLILIGLAFYALLDPQHLREVVSGRQAKYGSNALILGLAVLGILAVINFIGYTNSKRWDLTEDKSHTLAPETVQALQKLPQQVTAVAYFSKNMSPNTARTLLDEFKINAKGKFDYRFVDPDADPVTAQQDNIAQGQDGVVILKMGDRKEKVTSVDEQEMVTSMLRLSNPGERVIYFLSGHGELDPNGSDNTSYSAAKNALTGKNYTVKTLSLLVTHEIPKDAKAIVIAGPKKPFADSEVKLLQEYLANGGSAVILLEPSLTTNDASTAVDPLETMLAKDWGVQMKNDLVIDAGANPPTIAIANEYGDQAITQSLKTNQLVTLFPTARSIQVNSQTSSSLNPVELVKTSQQSWAETDLAALQNGQVTPDKNKDLLGPITLALSEENATKGSRLVVVGDADFAATSNFAAYGNGDLFVSMVDWTAKQDNLINLTPKPQTNRFMVPPERYTLGLILLGSIFIIPGAIVVSGISVWIRRRRRG